MGGGKADAGDGEFASRAAAAHLDFHIKRFAVKAIGDRKNDPGGVAKTPVAPVRAGGVLTPLARTTARARSAADQILAVLGANRILIDPADHDRILASTSHLPFLLSSTLALATPDECAPLIGPGFRSTSRLAGTPSSMMMGVLQTNRENILAALESVQDELALLISALAESDFETLQSTLDAAREKYTGLVNR